MDKYISYLYFVLLPLSALLLVVAMFDLPYIFYIFIRWLVFFASIVAIYEIRKAHVSWQFVFVVIGLIFNPFYPLTLDKSFWQALDIITVIVFIANVYNTSLNKDTYHKTRVTFFVWGILAFAILASVTIAINSILPSPYPVIYDSEGNIQDYRTTLALVASLPLVYFACYGFYAKYHNYSKTRTLIQEIDDEYNILESLNKDLQKKDDCKKQRLLNELTEVVYSRE